MLEFLVFLAALAFIRLTRRAPRVQPPVRIDVYHHFISGPGERRSMEGNVVPFHRDVA